MTVTLKASTATLKLNTGANIPEISLGTWRSLGATDGYDSVIAALKAGYRHIDTAAIYGNEDQVGKAIRDSGIPREEIFVTSKLWNTQQHNPAGALKDTLSRLGLDYLDLYLMHWPVTFNTRNVKGTDFMVIPKNENGKPDIEMDTWNFVKTWELMQELPATGMTKAVGVSNFSINNLKELLTSPGNKLTPAANQIEIHPLLPEHDLIKFCREKGIMIEASLFSIG